MNAYLILDLAIHDYETFRKYIENIPELIHKHSGRYVVQGVEPSVIEGDWNPERVVVIEFPSRAMANEFLNDPESTTLFQVRHSAATSRLILVDGCL